jgi:DNA modification methylase
MPVLQFKGKTAVENYHHTVPHHRLEFDAKLSLLGKGEKPSLDGNLIIEGDNLLALKALLPTHAGKVKCIYIDPPYNTGNEGWVYNDNLTQPQFKEWIGRTVGKEGEDACRHDKWCCMMYPRLTLLRELLREDGLIFVSIDFTEVSNLRLLMDEIFGSEHFLADIAWEKRYTRSNNAKLFYSLKDTLLVYRKSDAVSFLREERTEKSDGIYKNPDNDPKGEWTTSSYVNPATKEQRPNLVYKIKNPNTGKFVEHESHAWKYSRDTHEQHLAEKRLWWGEDGNSKYPRLKVYKGDNGLVPIDVWHWQQSGTSDEGGAALKEIFGSAVFENPKPVRLVRRILQLATDPDSNDVVLDSCAGSGTTAHAVLEQNLEDGGNRVVVLIQQPFDTKEDENKERNITSTITAERIRRISLGYTRQDQDSRGEHVAGIGGAFTYARLGAPLFGEYKDFGDELPAYEDIAKYVFYTETSREFPGTTKKQNPAWDKKAGRIGEHAGRSYYLLYEPNEREDRGLDRAFLKNIAGQDPNRELVVYCERLAVHQDELRKFDREHGKKIRPMLVPFNLK